MLTNLSWETFIGGSEASPMQMLKSVDHLLEQHMYIYFFLLNSRESLTSKLFTIFVRHSSSIFVPRRRGAPASIRIAATALFLPLCRVQWLISLSPSVFFIRRICLFYHFDLMIIITQNERGNLHFYASIASKTLWIMYVWAESNVNGRGGERLGPDQNLW